MQEAEQSREEAHERLHGVVADRAEEDLRGAAGDAQRRDQQEAGQDVEDAVRHREEAVRRRGGEAASAAHPAVPGLQVQAAEEGQAAR